LLHVRVRARLVLRQQQQQQHAALGVHRLFIHRELAVVRTDTI
jgi:hypothetical protein